MFWTLQDIVLSHAIAWLITRIKFYNFILRTFATLPCAYKTKLTDLWLCNYIVSISVISALGRNTVSTYMLFSASSLIRGSSVSSAHSHGYIVKTFRRGISVAFCNGASLVSPNRIIRGARANWSKTLYSARIKSSYRISQTDKKM